MSQQVGAGASPQLALSAVDRVLDLNHGSRLDQIDAALAADGRRLDVGVVAIGFTCGCEERWCMGRATRKLPRILSRWRLPGGPDAAREATPERRWHDVIVSTLPAATHRIFMDHRLVGCQDRGRGAEGGCYQQPGERVAVMHRQFGCATNVGALQAQTVQAPGSDLLLDPVSRRVRQDDLAGVPLEDNLHGGGRRLPAVPSPRRRSRPSQLRRAAPARYTTR